MAADRAHHVADASIRPASTAAETSCATATSARRSPTRATAGASAPTRSAALSPVATDGLCPTWCVLLEVTDVEAAERMAAAGAPDRLEAAGDDVPPPRGRAATAPWPRRPRPLGGGRRRPAPSPRWPASTPSSAARLDASTSRRSRRVAQPMSAGRRVRAPTSDPWSDVVGPGPRRSPMLRGASGPARSTPGCSSARTGRGKRGRGPGLRRRPARRRADGPATPTAAAAPARWPAPSSTPTSSWSSGRAPRSRAEQAERDRAPGQPLSPSRASRKVLCSTSSTSSADAAPEAAQDHRGAPGRARSSWSWPTTCPPELVTIASRCVRVDFAPLRRRGRRRPARGRGRRAGRGRRGGADRPAATSTGPASWPPTTASPSAWPPGATCPARLDGTGAHGRRSRRRAAGRHRRRRRPARGAPGGRGRRAGRARSSATASGARAPRCSRSATSASAAGSAPTSCAWAWPRWPTPTGPRRWATRAPPPARRRRRRRCPRPHLADHRRPGPQPHRGAAAPGPPARPAYGSLTPVADQSGRTSIAVHRLGEQEALAPGARRAGGGRPAGLGLDALGHRVEPAWRWRCRRRR